MLTSGLMLALHKQPFVKGLVAYALMGALLVGVAALSAGCAERLSKPVPATGAQFQVLETTKAEVLDALGLPTERAIDGTLERWGYAAGAVVSAVEVPAGAAPHALSVETITLFRAQRIVLIYFFDSTGLLVGVSDLREEE